jgi:hypothetical protein
MSRLQNLGSKNIPPTTYNKARIYSSSDTDGHVELLHQKEAKVTERSDGMSLHIGQNAESK